MPSRVARTSDALVFQLRVFKHFLSPFQVFLLFVILQSPCFIGALAEHG
jgi:hypothetical protein